MASRYFYSERIFNKYLGVQKEIKANSLSELEMKKKDQFAKWDAQEGKKRIREKIEDMKSRAEYDTEEALAKIKSYKEILSYSLQTNARLDWNKLYNKRPFRPFEFTEVYTPDYNSIAAKIGVPNESPFMEAIFSSRKRKRLDAQAEAQRQFDEQNKALEERKVQAQAEYEEEKEKYLARQQEHNKSIDDLKQKYENGDPEAIGNYTRLILEHAKYPDAIEKEFEVQFESISKTIVVNYQLPSPIDLPDTVQYKFVVSRKEITPVKMKQKEFDLFYESVLYQITLRTVHEIFRSEYTKHVECVVFNGWIEGVDTKTGKDFTSCIVSLQVSKEEFRDINLSRVDPKDCFRNLKGISAGALSLLAPVIPIMNINREDRRFVESKEVLAQINSSDNLATMNWEDFEHLVRELFERIFAIDGAEVKVTQASRDGGVDAIAFDPDPIRGGKFVIQAKRYNNVVPVSAVRDLYGTVINEGATKGILVTTSDYGRDSREFAKDKPLQLINGANLVHMFKEHGKNVHIALKKKA
ncbi:MAG: restriction endonuclease [Desulfosporosinus sp.]|nr:restriction endonuclease [Desulfosporosinus sp.]